MDRKRGKGSHAVLYIGSRRTIVSRGEYTKGTLGKMLRDLGIPHGEF